MTRSRQMGYGVRPLIEYFLRSAEIFFLNEYFEGFEVLLKINNIKNQLMIDKLELRRKKLLFQFITVGNKEDRKDFS